MSDQFRPRLRRRPARTRERLLRRLQRLRGWMNRLRAEVPASTVYEPAVVFTGEQARRTGFVPWLEPSDQPAEGSVGNAREQPGRRPRGPPRSAPADRAAGATP